MNAARRAAALCAVVAALAAVAARSQGIAGTGTDTDVVAAREAAQRGNLKALEALRSKLSGHALEAYPAYWLLQAQLERGVDPAEVRGFLERHADGPLADALRREWLKALGASGSWDAFRAEYPKLVGEDTELTCYAFQSRLAQGDAAAHAEARALFLAGSEAPPSCAPVFAELASARQVSEADVWDRIRKLLAANLRADAKRANAMLRADQAFSEKTLDRIATDPAKYLAAGKSPATGRAARELAIYAIGRLARARPDEAAERLEAIAPQLGPDDARYAWGQVAWQAALSHHARALEWYDAAGDTGLTDTQLAWRARAALRARDWKTVLASILRLSPEEARDSAWRYWRARALQELGAPEAAHVMLRAMASEPTFYGLLAADQLGVATAPQWAGWTPTEADLERVGARPGIRRSLALYRIDLDNEAFREWVWAIRGLDDKDLLSAAELARRAREPDRAINTAERTVQVHDFAQRFPTPHRDALEGAARSFDVNEAWLYAIIRQESRFMPEARSRVGATGLMQLMPATARWVARQLPVPAFQPSMLTRPDVNVQMGSYYFKRVLATLGDPVLATAAYNAGPGRARRWRDAQPLDGAIYIETIPFNETRDYVKKVVANAWFYTHRLTGKVASMRALVGTVPGRSSDAAGTAVAATLP